jgi:dolichyl-phosphate beta-glucosyltransferase
MPESIVLSVVIPAYNAASILDRSLPALRDWLQQQDLSFEIVVVDDGSLDKDKTALVCLTHQCRYLRNDRNLGKGAAVRKGILDARGLYRVFTDADIPYGTESIGNILNLLRQDLPVVIGDRTLTGSSYFSEIPWFRRISSAFFTHFVGRIVTSDFYDTQCGIKGFNAATAEKLFLLSRIHGFTFDVEVIYIALKLGIPITKVPVQLRNQEKSTVRVFRHGVLMFMDLFRIKWNHLLGRYRQNGIQAARTTASGYA